MKLVERFPDQAPPCISTINKILKQEGLTKKRRRRRRARPSLGKLAPPNGPNDLWTTDFKGQFRLGNRKWCYPLTLMDQCGRYLLGCKGQLSIKSSLTKESFIELFEEYGLPDRIRSDNGVPFSSVATVGLSTLSAWWIRLGIVPERIQPGKPQQNGHHERMHRTLKKYATRPASYSLSAQQQRFDAFKKEFNHERPHESLDQQYPATVYRPSIRTYPKALPEIEYSSYLDVYKVHSSGIIYWGGGQVYVSHILKGEWVGVEQIDDNVFDLYFSFYRLGSFDIRNQHTGETPYWSLVKL